MIYDEAQTRSYHSVFLHFFDTHFLELKRAHLYLKMVASEARLATRFSILIGDEVLLPAASYFESSICNSIIGGLAPLYKHGLVWLIGGAANIEEFIYRKLQQYDPRSSQYERYLSARLENLPPFRTRFSSSTADIRDHWEGLLSARIGLSWIGAGTRYHLPCDFERRWESVPNNLDGRAFIVPYVAPLLLGKDLHPTIVNRLHAVINEAYFASYIEEFHSSTVGDLVYLAAPHPVPSCGLQLPFKRILREARQSGILRKIEEADAFSLLALKENEQWQSCAARAIAQAAGQAQVPTRIHFKERTEMEKLRCFITHGHDSGLKLELKDYLQNTLKVPEPIILHQQPNRGRTVIEKFEECSDQVDVAFVLLTPDDIGGLTTAELKERARQNVIYELGVFVGRFGRKSGRVILLHKGTLELPSDLFGVIYIDVNQGIDAAGEAIRKELVHLTRRS